MKKFSLLLFVILISCLGLFAQEKEAAKSSEPKVYEAKTEDVSSIDAIIKATYDVISGDAGEERDWDRMRSLFYQGARLIPSGTNPQTGKAGARVMTVDDYIKTNSPFFEQNGFHEKELARKTDIFGNIAQIFSTYEGKFKQNGEDRTMRGINSFQLLNDGERWWILTIYWQAETPNAPIPEKYMKTSD